MPNRGNRVPLILGIIFVAIGGVFLWANFYDFRPPWRLLARFALPALFLWLGLRKLSRHFLWDAHRLARYPTKSSLLGGIFWTSLGALLLLEMLVDIELLQTVSRYWPVLLILFGAGKILDFYRLGGALQFRPRELVGIVFVCAAGLLFAYVADAHFRLINFDIPLIFEDKRISLGRLGGEKYRRESIHVNLPAENIRSIALTNLYGDIRVEGADVEQIDIELARVIVAVSEARAAEVGEQIRLVTEREGSSLRIGTNREMLSEDLQFNTHFTIRTPRNMQVQVANRFGAVRVSGIQGPCELENSYGEVRAESIAGAVEIRNEYQSVTVLEVGGPLTVTNRRGSIRAEEVAGNADLNTEYDPIVAKKIAGALTVQNRFGSVRIEEVSGPVHVEAPGSRVNLSDAGESVRIENSHNDVTVTRLSKDLELDTSYNRVTLSQVPGSVAVRSAHSDIRAENLGSGINVQGRVSAVDMKNVKGPIRIVSSLRSVRISDFEGTVEVQNEYGEVNLSTGASLTGNATVTNQNGDIVFAAPQGSGFRLFAQAEGGTVISDFKPESRPAGENVQMLEMAVGQGGPEVRLQTTYAQIYIRRE